MSTYFIDTITAAQAAGFDAARDNLVFGATGETARSVRVQFNPATASSSESITVTSGVTGASAVFGAGFAGARPILPDSSLMIVGGATAETITGAGGSDGLWGGGGTDTLDGGDGQDVLGGGPGADLLRGGPGADTFVIFTRDSGVASGSLDRIADWSSSDRLAFRTAATDGNFIQQAVASYDAALASANAAIAGGSVTYVAVQVGSDVVVFADTAGDHGVAEDAVVLSGRSLSDITAVNIVASGGAGATPPPPPTQGTPGADTLTGGAGADSFAGGLGDDQLRGLDGADTLDGGAGADTLFGDSGADLFIFGVGEAGTAEGRLDLVRDLEPSDRLVFGGGNLAPGLLRISGPTSFAAAQDLANARIAAGEANFVLVTVGGSNHYLFVDSRNDNGQADDVVELGSNGVYLSDSGLVTGAAAPSEPELPGPSVPPGLFRDALVIISGDMDQAHLSHALNAIITRASDSNVEAHVGDVTLRLDGFGFSTDSAGHLNGGTATSISYSYGAAEGAPFSLQFAGQQVPLLTLANWLANDLTQEAFAGLLSGSNSLNGGNGNDVLRGFAGADYINGLGGSDVIWGGPGSDIIFALQPRSDAGPAGSTYLRGEEGDDYIIGAAGFDDINGNQGNDTASGGVSNDWVVGGKDNDLLFGDGGNDLVYGNLGSDTCVGGDGADIVRGGQDNDLCFGSAGDDFVSGDKGDDTMTGGAGADIFHTFGDAGIDRVTDFNLAQGDRVQLDPGTQFTVSQSGADTVISMTGGGQMVLVGVSMSTLTGNWIFGA